MRRCRGMLPLRSVSTTSNTTTATTILLFALLGSLMMMTNRIPMVVNGFSSSPSGGSRNFRRSKIPEQVVQDQLDALASYDIRKAFQYNSESNQAVTGPWQSFASSLAEPPFRPLLGHTESTVLMTVCHDDSDYVGCLVRVVPNSSNSENSLPEALSKVIADNRRLEGMLGELDEDEDEEDEDDEDEDDESMGLQEAKNSHSSCILYWWEVSKQFDNNNNDDDDDDDDDDFYYLVDSVLPDAEDLELDYMETTLFAIGDEDYDDDDDDDPSTFFFNLGMGL